MTVFVSHYPTCATPVQCKGSVQILRGVHIVLLNTTPHNVRAVCSNFGQYAHRLIVCHTAQCTSGIKLVGQCETVL